MTEWEMDREIALRGGTEKDLFCCCLGNCKDDNAIDGDWKTEKVLRGKITSSVSSTLRLRCL